MNLPDKPGVYLFKNEQGEVIYVGKAVSLKNRVQSYFQNSRFHGTKISALVSHISDVDYIVTDSEIEALILENSLIKQYKPRYNANLKDDKQYPYLKLTVQEEYSRLIITRKLERDGSRYFGPYTNAGSLRDTLKILKKVFPLRSCREKFRVRGKERPCLNHHIKYCLAPCQGHISREEYDGIVKGLIYYLEGRQEAILKNIEKEMKKASGELDFERAADLRDKYLALKQVISRQKVVSPTLKEHDVIGFARGKRETCLQIFLIRQGKIIGKEQFTLINTEEMEDGEVITAFIKQYYSTSSSIPREIMVPVEIQEREVLESWLSQKRGPKVSFYLPKRGLKKELLEMVMHNALLFLEKKTHEEEEKKQLLKKLAEVLDLGEVPERIEGFDISNIQGREMVASMVVFQAGLPDKKSYRRFRLDGFEGPDDYRAMKEVITRRLKGGLRERDELAEGTLDSNNAKFIPLPEMMLIDGGKGQLRAALEALKELEIEKISLVSLAKKEEYVFLPGRKDPVILPANSPVLRLLQRVRDEAHRFALSYHRHLRGKETINSVLTEIPGLGEKRQKSLLMHFGSIEVIKEASVEELCSVPGIDRKTAEAIYRYLRSEK